MHHVYIILFVLKQQKHEYFLHRNWFFPQITEFVFFVCLFDVVLTIM
jgi:hypothetical protein